MNQTVIPHPSSDRLHAVVSVLRWSISAGLLGLAAALGAVAVSLSGIPGIALLLVAAGPVLSAVPVWRVLGALERDLAGTTSPSTVQPLAPVVELRPLRAVAS